MNVKLQNCLRGKLTADQACDHIITALDQVKRAR
jgi:hypothetical protein